MFAKKDNLKQGQRKTLTTWHSLFSCILFRDCPPFKQNGLGWGSFLSYWHCAVLKNTHTSPTEGQWKFLRGGGEVAKAKDIVKSTYGVKLEFLEWEGAEQKPCMGRGGMDIKFFEPHIQKSVLIPSVHYVDVESHPIHMSVP